MFVLNATKFVAEGKQAWPGMQYGAAALTSSAPERALRAEVKRKSMGGEEKGIRFVPDPHTRPKSSVLRLSTPALDPVARHGSEKQRQPRTSTEVMNGLAIEFAYMSCHVEGLAHGFQPDSSF